MTPGLRLTVVGCSGSYAGPDSPASCYLLEADDSTGRTWRVLLDLGSGALGTLQRFADPSTVDAVLLSHLHPDHYFDLSGLYVVWKYHPDGVRPRIPVWGPKGTGEQAARAYGLPPEKGMREEFEFLEYDGRPVVLGPITVHVTRVAHPVTAYGMRIRVGDSVLAYSGDTGPCHELVEVARDADLLLCEAAFVEAPDNPPGLHLTGREAGEAAAKAGARSLVITHVPPWHDPEHALSEARKVYDGPVELAATGSTYRL